MTSLMLMGSGLAGSPVAGGGGAGPSAFSYTTDSSVPVSTLYTAAGAVLSGTGDPWVLTLSGSGFEYQINGGAWLTIAGVASSGDTIAIRGTSSASLSTNLVGTLTIGTTVGTYTIGTVATTACSTYITAVRAATSDPGPTQRGNYNTLFSALNTGSILTSCFDLLWVVGVDAAATNINLINPGTFNLVPSNVAGSNPVFTAGPSASAGYAGNGVSGTGAGSAYLDTGFNPSTASSPNYVLNSASIHIWTPTNANESTWRDVGQLTLGANGLCTVLNANSGGFIRGIVNIAAGFINFQAISGTPGLISLIRSSTSVTNAAQNGAFGATDSTASGALPNAVITFLADVNTGSRFSGRKQCGGAIGRKLNSTELTAFYNAMRTYMTAMSIP